MFFADDYKNFDSNVEFWLTVIARPEECNIQLNVIRLDDGLWACSTSLLLNPQRLPCNRRIHHTRLVLTSEAAHAECHLNTCTSKKIVVVCNAVSFGRMVAYQITFGPDQTFIRPSAAVRGAIKHHCCCLSFVRKSLLIGHWLGAKPRNIGMHQAKKRRSN